MLGINEIGSKNALMTETKNTPSFGSAYTPSFGSTTYHDEFVSSHENGVTVKQIGLFALIGLAIGAGVALLLKKPSAGTKEEIEHIVEYQLQERGWLKRLFTSTPEEIQRKAEIKAARVAADAEAKAKKIDANAVIEKAKIDAKAKTAEAEAKLKAAKATPSKPTNVGITPAIDKFKLTEKAKEAAEKAKEAREAYEAIHGGKTSKIIGYFGKENRAVRKLENEAKKAQEAAKKAGASIKEIEGLKPEDYRVDTPAAPAPTTPEPPTAAVKPTDAEIKPTDTKVDTIEKPADAAVKPAGAAEEVKPASEAAKAVETVTSKTAKQIADELKDIDIKTAETNLIESVKARRKEYLRTQEGYKGLSDAEFEVEFDKHWTPSKNEVVDHENHYLDALISKNEAKINYSGIGKKRIYNQEQLEYAKAYAKQKGYNMVLEEGIRDSIEINLEKI